MQFDDGYLDLIVMRECPKLRLLSLMNEMSDGRYVKSPHVLYTKVSASNDTFRVLVLYFARGS